MNWFEIFGFTAPIAVLISFLMKELNTLRLVNSVGCLLFIAYGFLADPFLWPVIITNAAIICINFFYIFKSKTA